MTKQPVQSIIICPGLRSNLDIIIDDVYLSFLFTYQNRSTPSVGGRNE